MRQAPEWFEPFSGSDHYIADLIRLALLIPCIFLALTVIAVSYRRFRSAPDSIERARNGWALLSYGAFILVDAMFILDKFGNPLNIPRFLVTVVALGSGVIAAFQMFSLRRRQEGGNPLQRQADELEGRAAREDRERRANRNREA